MAYLLLTVSVVLSTGRNLLLKKLSSVGFGTRSFYLSQGLLFLCGGIVLLFLGKNPFGSVAFDTFLFAALYGLLLILAQWFYTMAIGRGNITLCSTVYSLGFIFPALSGAILWSEAFSLFDLLGIVCAMSAVIVSGLRPNEKKKADKANGFIPLVIAMLASGGLGIVQKLQQKSAYAEQKSVFLLLAFAFAAGISLLFSLFAEKRKDMPLQRRDLAVASCVGLFFGCCNFLNTTLAGLLDSSSLYPMLNIGIILLSMLCGVAFFKEKINKRESIVLVLGIASILLLNFG
ncbi:MAG: hypothetical protein E7655_08695 [Ruminococcaceae bacterium]|nr:hypothetical protein [Oscillospiraceae bacterium]